VPEVRGFRTEAVRIGDEAAERTLDDASRKVPRRIERLLRHQLAQACRW
jgi:hypothetical protein